MSPYISKKERERLTVPIEPNIITPGELNFLISSLVEKYLAQPSKSARYEYINDVLGALEGAKLEVYRRLAAPYEDAKRKENGEVFNESIERYDPRKGKGRK